MTAAFANEPLLELRRTHVREQALSALAQLDARLPLRVPIFVAGEEMRGGDSFVSVDPGAPARVVAEAQAATAEHVDRAVQTASGAWRGWAARGADHRAAVLSRAAGILRAQRLELAALAVRECAKPWKEADADVAEAIDFLEYYGAQARLLESGGGAGRELLQVPGEHNVLRYDARGVVGVIAPWNFPLAILTGQVVSALVTGNTVVMKPAEQSSLVAKGLMDILREAGFPADVVHFLPGYGEEVGEYLVNHALTTTIAFTGSKAVGLHIMKRAAEVKPGQQHVKRCIIEMGGKNAIIVDNDADLDEAVDGVLYSAFGFAGQKCSACSRVIVLDEVYDRFVDRLAEAAKSYKVRDAVDGDADLGPVVDRDAYDRIRAMIADGKTKHKLLFEEQMPATGYFISPTIFADVKPGDRLAQEEVFGPVLAVLRAKDMDEALRIANGTEYALTGGVFSRSPANIEKIRDEYECGNLYINRGITGAMVDRHPFGGFKMSGIGSKTGGPDYLRQFTEPVVVTENTMRRGFAPVEEGE